MSREKVPTPQTRPTLRQVAAKAGVSVSTVSRALMEETPKISDATCARVRAAARELGYRPRSQTMETTAVGFIVTSNRLLPHSVLPEGTMVRERMDAWASLRDHVRHDVLPVGHKWRVYALVPVTIRRPGEP